MAIWNSLTHFKPMFRFIFVLFPVFCRESIKINGKKLKQTEKRNHKKMNCQAFLRTRTLSCVEKKCSSGMNIFILLNLENHY